MTVIGFPIEISVTGGQLTKLGGLNLPGLVAYDNDGSG